MAPMAEPGKRQRRWFQFSLRRLVFWDVPCVALIALTLTPLLYLPRVESPFDVEAWARAIAHGALIELAAILTLAWLLLPVAMRLVIWAWSRWKNRPTN
jgi:hypothetical protein